ncbi:NADPH-dependent F420 reductase [Staphylococcus xylosus]
MNFGIIGAGPIALGIERRLINANHNVKVADARSIEKLNNKNVQSHKVSLQEVAKDIDILILSIPIQSINLVKDTIKQLENHVLVVDTSNYYPMMYGNIEVLDQGEVESVWVSNQLNRNIVKAFNNQLAYTLQSATQSDRIAYSVAGDDQFQKQRIMELIEEIGFEAVDGGTLDESWRQQPGTPAYCTELNKEQMVQALKDADKEKSYVLKNEIMSKFTPSMTHDDIVQLNRKTFGNF